MRRLYVRFLYGHRGHRTFLGSVEYRVFRLWPRWYWHTRGY